jgi:NAD(P)-dependent dehydrogenase (short-subunit alcohol dehydrogenase family)
MQALADKVAIVTGASSGIGHATAKLFAQEGASVVVTARRRAELDALVTQIIAAGGRAIAVAGDVRDETLAKELVDTAVERFGGLDIAFNNAGALGEMGSVADVSLAGWRDTLDVNLTSAFLGAKYQVPAMLRRGGGSFVREHSGSPGLRRRAARTQAHCETGGDRAVGAGGECQRNNLVGGVLRSL